MNSLPVYCFGISCKTADEQLRGRLVVPASAVPDLIGYFIRETGISGAVVISTCNRTEVYFSDVAADTESCSARENARIQNVFSRLDAILCDFAGADIHQMRRYLRYYSGISAVEHLLKVTTSLDSLNIGENEIQGQINRAYTLSRNAGFTDFYLNQMFQQTQHYAKLIRVRAGFSNTAVSYGTLVCNEIAAFAERCRIASPNIMLIGATGQLGSNILKTVKNRDVGNIYITTRNSHENSPRGSEIPVPYASRYRYLKDVSILISVTSSPHFTVTYDECLQEINREHPCLCIDLCVPRDIDPDLGRIPGIELLDFSYFADIIKNHRQKRFSGARLVSRDIRTGALEIQSYIADKIQKRSLFRSLAVSVDACSDSVISGSPEPLLFRKLSEV